MKDQFYPSVQTNLAGMHEMTMTKRKRPIAATGLSFSYISKHALKSHSLPVMGMRKSKSTTVIGGNMKNAGWTNTLNPQSCLEEILQSKGGKLYKVHSFDSLPNFFQDLKQEEVDAYGFDVIRAVRESDIDTLRKYHKEGRPLKCSNRFGESLLHLACRKALVEVVDFLVNEVEVPLCVKDDMGRTPLADAFWTTEPNMELVDIIIRKCPDLLFISDKRGHTPLAYARQQHWDKWNEYLKSRSDLVLPKILNQELDCHA